MKKQNVSQYCTQLMKWVQFRTPQIAIIFDTRQQTLKQLQMVQLLSECLELHRLRYRSSFIQESD